MPQVTHSKGVVAAAREILDQFVDRAIREVPSNIDFAADIIERHAHAGEMERLLRAMFSLVDADNGGEYSIVRTDKAEMPLGEFMPIESTFGKVEALLAALDANKEGQDGRQGTGQIHRSHSQGLRASGAGLAGGGGIEGAVTLGKELVICKVHLDNGDAVCLSCRFAMDWNCARKLCECGEPAIGYTFTAIDEPVGYFCEAHFDVGREAWAAEQLKRREIIVQC